MCDCCKPKAVSSAATEKCEKGKDPKTCSPQQIKECHGDVKEHACVAAVKSSK